MTGLATGSSVFRPRRDVRPRDRRWTSIRHCLGTTVPINRRGISYKLCIRPPMPPGAKALRGSPCPPCLPRRSVRCNRSAMSACAPRRSTIGRATAQSSWGCKQPTAAARRSRSAWTTASSAHRHADGGEGIAFFGWEVADAAALDALAARLEEAHGVKVARGRARSPTSGVSPT